MRGYTEEEIEEQSRMARQAAGIDDQLRPDMMTIFSAFKRNELRPFNYRRCLSADLPDSEACWDSGERVLSLREETFQGANRNEARARFTVAHELGHFWLKHAGIRNRAITPTIAERAVPQIRREEREAMRFASAFLAPAHLIDPYASIEEIVETFLLSKPAAIIRSDELQRIHRRRHGLERPLPSFVEDFLRNTKW